VRGLNDVVIIEPYSRRRQYGLFCIGSSTAEPNSSIGEREVATFAPNSRTTFPFVAIGYIEYDYFLLGTL